jgi:hypothetical protein
MIDTSINNAADIIDSRDIIARIEELQDERQGLADELEEAAAGDDEAATEAAQAALQDWDGTEEGQELRALLALQDEAEGYVDDWRHGAPLIRGSYFTEYAQQMAEDIGAINRNAAWPLMHIDWDAAAEDLKQDYTSVDFDGVEYWVR